MPKPKGFFSNFIKISATAKIFFLQNLSVMIKTGVPLDSALMTLGEQTKNKKLKAILGDVYEQVKQGKTLSESLNPYQDDFGELFINMIRAGEASGNLEEILKKLHLQHKRDHELKMKVKNAMTYPAVIVVAMLGIGLFMVIFVLPNITKLFKELDAELPLSTKVMIFVSDFTQKNGLIIAIALVVILAILIRLAKSKKGKGTFDKILLVLPVVAPIIKKINLARAARSLSSLIKTDIAIAESLLITSRILGNASYRAALADAAEEVKKGDKLEIIFKKYPKLFPPMITQMIAIGEETGALDEILDNLAGFYEEEVGQTMDTLPTIIEPVLMILIGAAVGLIAVAIMMPMYSLTQSF